MVFHADNITSCSSHLKSYSHAPHLITQCDILWGEGGTSTALAWTFLCFRDTHRQSCFIIRISAHASIIGTGAASITTSA